MIKIHQVSKSDYPELIKVWEESVRVTHHFLKQKDIAYFKSLILETYFDAVQLRCTKTENNKITGFIGCVDKGIEMLFLAPQYRGQGIGKVLVEFAIAQFDIDKVDVNQDNRQALGFYNKIGFKVVKRSEKDGFGKPYPILHMKLKNKIDHENNQY